MRECNVGNKERKSITEQLRKEREKKEGMSEKRQIRFNKIYGGKKR
jgi:hypothetical protein